VKIAESIDHNIDPGNLFFYRFDWSVFSNVSFSTFPRGPGLPDGLFSNPKFQIG
jgi:hypothetical protein